MTEVEGNAPLTVLIVEDVEDDCALTVRELRRAGYLPTFLRVETAQTFVAALAERTWDLVISDYSLPQFNAPSALALLQKHDVDIPFIIVSGTNSEDSTVAAMKAGAHDYLSKGQLKRLGPAIARELREATVRAAQRQTEAQLMVSERMASVGVLAAGVAHEINNPLVCVLANLDYALLELKEHGVAAGGNSEVDRALREARDASERVRQIVRDLKTFSRADEAERRAPVDVEKVLESSLRMASNEIRHRARLVKDFAHVPNVFANDARLGQVFLNLIVNAAQAIPEGRATENELRVTTRVNDGIVSIEVRDTGTGMSPQVQARLFTPFFTTKPVGMGTGIGLSICHRLITAIGGKIKVDSQEGKGTSFTVLLPVTDAVEVALPAAVGAPSANRRGRILVIDDEAMIATAIARTLSKEHEVQTMVSAVEALAVLAAGVQFDVVLCDLMMPDMTGMQLHAELEVVAPSVAEKMIFLSGGAFTTEARTFLDHSPNLRIDKPFDAKELRAIVNDRLGARK